jgi:hypothetical protein
MGGCGRVQLTDWLSASRAKEAHSGSAKVANTYGLDGSGHTTWITVPKNSSAERTCRTRACRCEHGYARRTLSAWAVRLRGRLD